MPNLRQPVQSVPFPHDEIALLFLTFWHAEAGDFKHLGIKRTYEKTNYATIERNNYDHTISEADNILRYNMYYIMHQMKNVKKAVINFTQYGLISLDKKSEIVKPNKHEKLMRLELMKEILTIPKAKFPTVEKALVESDNKLVWILIKPPPTTNAAAAAGSSSQLTATAAAGGSGPSRQPRSVPQEPRWDCLGCTSPNPETVNSCLVCTTPRAVNVPQNGWTCQECTAQNEDILRFCSACDTRRPATATTPVNAATATANQGPDALGEWSCASCTFKNSADVGQCIVCSGPGPRHLDLNQTVNLGEHGPRVACPQCTSLNSAVAWRCAVCDGRLGDEEDTSDSQGLNGSLDEEDEDRY